MNRRISRRSCQSAPDKSNGSLDAASGRHPPGRSAQIPAVACADGTCYEAGGADQLHVDVMDGRFVPKITIGPPVIESIGKRTRPPLDVHVMIVEPERYIETFVRAGV